MNGDTQMDPDFPRWIRSITLDPLDPKVAARAAAVRALADDDAADAELLLRVGLGEARLVAKKEQVERVQKILKLADSTFDPSESSAEVRTLVLAALATAMRGHPAKKRGTLLALATATSLFGGERAQKLDFDLMGIARDRIVKASEAATKRPELTLFIQADAMKGEYEKASAAAKAAGDLPTAVNDVMQAVDVLRRGYLSMAQKQAQAYRNFEEFIRVQDEELQILWWLVGGYSETAEAPFTEIAAEKRTFLLPHDVARFTRSLSEPLSLRGLLERAGINAHLEASVPTVVNSFDGTEAERLVVGVKPSSLLTPLHFALERRLETGPGKEWVANWAAVTDLPGDKEFNVLALAVQFFRERQVLAFGG